MSSIRFGTCNTASEWDFISGKSYTDPFNEVELDVVFTDPAGNEWRVPAFWAGGDEWRVRFAPRLAGTYQYHSVCSDEFNADLHGQQGTLTVHDYVGDNPLLTHGSLQVSADRRYLEHLDGTPFFWLGDTWWMGLCQRIHWPDDFQLLTADRKAKGFTVIQIVAGLYPDMPPFDPRGANEAGYPWTEDFGHINPAYFDMADLRIRWLVRSGLLPCIVSCWGYFLPLMGTEKLKKHWRYLIARYGAYPVAWCLSGEGIMPFYLSKNREADAKAQKQGWTEIGRYVHTIDPYHHPITIHPTDAGRNQVEDPAVLDFDMLQTGHSGHESIPNTVKSVRAAVAREPRMPVIDGEVCYEGILESSREEIQRFMYWSCMLSGAAGHTYGANGIWQLNSTGKPFGPSPHGMSWGNTPWQEAYRLPGSGQLGIAKRLLQRFEWWRFEPHQEWIEPSASTDDYLNPYGAGIPGKVRIFYFPRPIGSMPIYLVCGLEADSLYDAFFFDPKTGQEFPLGRVNQLTDHTWRIPSTQIFQDWVLVLESRE